MLGTAEVMDDARGVDFGGAASTW